MNLKEAFRYQNFLNKLIDEATLDILDRSFYMTTTKTHHCHAENEKAEDFVEISNSNPNRAYRVDNVLTFLMQLIQEKDILSHTINEAKANLDIDIDADIETNKQRQKVSNALNMITRQKTNTKQVSGTAYNFNTNGEQVPYYYTIDVEEIPAYDVNMAKYLSRSLMEDSDNLSKEIDQAIVNTMLDYYPKYDINSSYEDNLLNFIPSSNK